MEGLALERLEALDTELQAGGDQFAVRALLQRVVNDRLVLIDRDGARRVNDVATRGARGRARVEGAENQLLLQVREQLEVPLGLRVNLRAESGHQPVYIPC